jgi:hypothetical protein
MRLRSLLTGLLLLGAFSTAGYARDAMKTHKPGDRVLLRGCVEQGTPEFCRKLSGYNVTAAYPTLRVGQFVELAGTIGTSVSPCPGTILFDITYQAPPVFCSRRK